MHQTSGKMQGVGFLPPADENCKARVSVIDEAINAIDGEVSRYESGLYRLINKLESPRPEVCCEGQGRPQPPTLEMALSDIHSRLINATDGLNNTIKRIEEQVGELKILP